MKKIIAVIPITILFILLSFDIKVQCDTVLNSQAVWLYGNITGSSQGSKRWYLCTSQGNNGIVVLTKNSSQIYFSGYIYDANVGQLEGNRVSSAYLYYIDSYVLGGATISYTGSGQDDLNGFDSVEEYEDYINPPVNNTWYDDMFETFIGAIEGIASVATGGFSNLVEAFTEFWVVPVGGDEGDMFFPTDIPMASPTPTPTPIQYQTVIAPTTDPQGNVIYQYKYVYNNPSGTPIITSSPPVNSNYGGGDSFDYPYYDNPDNRNNPYKLKIPWYLKLIFGNKIVDETTLDDSVNVIQDYMNDDDINDGVTTVYDGMSAIPTDWLILIGVIASIPLFGCLISRLLS